MTEELRSLNGVWDYLPDPDGEWEASERRCHFDLRTILEGSL